MPTAHPTAGLGVNPVNRNSFWVLPAFLYPIYREYRRYLAKGLPLGVCALLSQAIVFADAPQMTGIHFSGQVLQMQGSASLPKPEIQSWPSTSGSQPTEIVVIDFSQVESDIRTLQTQAHDILKTWPEVKRLVITPLANHKLRVMIEMSLGKDGKPLQPVLIQRSPFWLLGLGTTKPAPIETPIALHADTGKNSARLEPRNTTRADEVLNVQALHLEPPADPNGAPVDTRAKNSLTKRGKTAVDEIDPLKAQIKALSANLRNTKEHLQASIEENVQLQRELEALRRKEQETQKLKDELKARREEQRNPKDDKENKNKKQRTSEQETASVLAQQEILSLAEDLQTVINERSELERQVFSLQQELTALKQETAERDQKIESLRHQASLSTEFIRMYDPLMQGSSRLENMQRALLKLATRLKDTEAALEKQTEKTVALATELADLKKDPAILEDPTLTYKPTPKEEKPSILLTAPDEIPGTLLYAKPTVVTEKLVNSEGPQLQETHDNAADLEQYRQFVSKKKYNDAESSLMDILSNNPTHSQAYLELTKLYLMKNKAMQAMAALETYKRLNPIDESIPLIQAQIQSKLIKEKR